MTEKQEIPLATENKHAPESLGENPSVSKRRRGQFWLIVILLIVFGGGYLFGAFYFTFKVHRKFVQHIFVLIYTLSQSKHLFYRTIRHDAF